MRKMTKFLTLLIAVSMLVGILGACGQKEDAPMPDSGSDSHVGDTDADAPAEDGDATPEDEELEDTDSLTLYYSHSSEWADPIIQEFQETTGIRVDLVGGGTGELISRVTAEADNPLADVLWGGVVDSYEGIPELLQPYESPEAPSLLDIAVDDEFMWYGFDISPMVVIYNTKLVSEDEAPKTWMDLTDEKWKGQIACADPLSSSSSMATIMAMIMAYGKDDGGGYEFVGELVRNLDGKIITSSSGTYKGVADGEYPIGMTYEEAALRYIQSGADIAIVYPEEGTNASPSGIGIVKDCKNLKNARAFIDFVIGKSVQEKLGALNRRTVRKDVEDPDTMVATEDVPLVDFDMQWVANNQDEFADVWKDFVTE